MANSTQQEMFGGAWTERKLECLEKYLRAYINIFKKNERAQFFQTHYVDAFAGTGSIPKPEFPASPLFPELQKEVADFSAGSAVRALEVSPSFDHYLFIERDSKRAQELEQLKLRFSSRAMNIEVQNADANPFLKQWCESIDWSTNRAVAFLDPFGMEVDWKLIETIANTKAIDLWLLFPLFATNRMLVRSGRPSEAWARRLDQVFGTQEWVSQFYRTEESTLIEGVEFTTKTGNLDKIQDFFMGRLRTVFAAVADPMVLRNNRGSPLYLFCFAAGNPKGAPIAVRIAQHLTGE